jgi:cell wall-associated NlpC family hydrolase
VQYHFNARWYDAETARFISEDPARDGVSWFAYVGQNPLRYIDPTGLRRVDGDTADSNQDRQQHRADRENRRRERQERREARRVQRQLLDMRNQRDLGITSQELSQSDLIKLDQDIRDFEDTLIDNLTVAAYDEIAETVDNILNERLAEYAEELEGSYYVWGGKPDNEYDGLDCSGTSEAVIEAASGMLVRTRNANGQIMDENLTVPGNGSRGTLNYYDWQGDGRYDHVTVQLGNNRILNPRGDDENGPDNPGIIEIRQPFNTVPNNRQVNWRYILFD